MCSSLLISEWICLLMNQIFNTSYSLCFCFTGLWSYSYDVTHTLQYNLLPCKLPSDLCSDEAQSSKVEFWQTEGVRDEYIHDSIHIDTDIEDASSAIQNPLESDETSSSPDPKPPSADSNTNKSSSHQPTKTDEKIKPGTIWWR